MEEVVRRGDKDRIMKIFFLTAKFPSPQDQGDKLRGYWQIRHLAKNHEIHLCSLSQKKVSDKQLANINPFCAAVRIIPLNTINIMGGLLQKSWTSLPLQVCYYSSAKICRQIQDFLGEVDPDIVFCQLIRMAAAIEDSRIPVVLDFMDALSDRVRQKANYPLIPRCILDLEYRRTKAYERDLLEKFNSFIITTANEREKSHLLILAGYLYQLTELILRNGSLQ